MNEVAEEMVRSWAGKFSQVGLVVLGAGPPCQGVSGLNASRKGVEAAFFPMSDESKTCWSPFSHGLR